ncbi:MAG: sulfatase [Proteobacteria bacterium]|nr:sulfatase [Pseudomonadota bacterium]
MSFPRAGRWIAPSLVAAFAGAIATGLFDALTGDDDLEPMAVAATTGFVALLAAPLLLTLALALRGVIAAWRPRALVAELVEDAAGAAPRLAGWLVVVALALAAFAWSGFQATWVLNRWTSFKPVPVAFGMAVFGLGTGVVALALSRPLAHALAWLARRLDARWRRDRPNRRSLVTIRKIVVGTTVLVGALTAVAWAFARGRLGPIDLGLAYGPAIGLGVLVGAHVGWHKLGRTRWIAGALATTALGVAIASAFTVEQRHPSVALGIWGDKPLAGLAIDTLFDLDTIRANVSLAQFRPGVRSDAEHPDIVLVTIDTVRADHTPPYQGKAEMPGLRALGERGVVFEYAFAPGNVTRRSIPSMMIGLAPNRVKGRVVGWALRVDPRHVLLAERMRAGGYDTAGFMCCEGFYGPEAHTGLQRGLEHLEIEKNGLLLARRAHVWLAERDRQLAGKPRKPLFVWMHVLEPHVWTTISGEPHTDEERQKFYDRALQQADGVLVETLSAFTQRRPEEAPIVIVTADHGEALGEHGQPYHSTDLYNSQIRVPFVLAGPGIKPGRVTESISLTDLVPTVMDLAGFVPPTGPSIDGRSLAPLITGARHEDLAGGVAFSAMIADRSNPGGLASVVRGKYKLISNGSFYELYDVRADPDEAFNIHQRFPVVLTELKKLLNDKLRAAKASPFD